MLAAVTTPGWLGTVPAWALLLMGLAVAWRVSRGGGGSAVSELSKANEVLTRSIKERDDRLHELGSEVRDLRVDNERLKSRTDFAAAFSPVLQGVTESTQRAEVRQRQILEAQVHHEERAADRQAGTLLVLERIANQLASLSDKSTPV